MAYRRSENYGHVDFTPPNMRTVEKLEERRFLLSLLAVICAVFCISQLYGDYRGGFAVQALLNGLVDFCLSLI